MEIYTECISILFSCCNNRLDKVEEVETFIVLPTQHEKSRRESFRYYLVFCLSFVWRKHYVIYIIFIIGIQLQEPGAYDL